MKTDTIAAIATGMSNSGIGIVRISGEQAFSVIDSIFRNRKGERVRLSLSQSHTVHYGYIYDGDEKVDEALAIIMKGPHSYTAEDTVEIDCHGGVLMVRRILETVLHAGARVPSTQASRKVYLLSDYAANGAISSISWSQSSV